MQINAPFFKVGVPLSYRPKLRAFIKLLEENAGRKFSIREVVCMLLAKGMNAPYLYDDIIREREVRKEIRQDEIAKKRMEREAARETKREAKREAEREAKLKRDKEKAELKLKLKAEKAKKEETLDELVAKASTMIEGFKHKRHVPAKRRRRTKAEVEAARLEERRQKAMKAQPETFMTDIPK